VLVVGVALSGTLGIVLNRSVTSARQHLRLSQVHEVESAIRATLQPVQAPLVSIARLAGEGDLTAVRSLAQSEVGDGAPFTNLTLWSIHNGAASLAFADGVAGSRLQRIDAAISATITSRARGPTGSGAGVVYLDSRPTALLYLESASQHRYLAVGEVTLPTGRLRLPSNSPLAGLAFAWYLGAPPGAMHPVESTLQAGESGPTLASMPYAGQTASIVMGAPASSGTLPTWSGSLVIALGLLLTVLIAGFAFVVTRRRAQAEQREEAMRRKAETQILVSRQIQEILLPPVTDDAAGIEVHARHITGSTDFEIGGDWYDTVEVAGTLVACIGDVAGRGIDAASTMSMLRNGHRAYALERLAPDEILSRLDEMVRVQRGDRFATALCLRIHCDTGVVEVSNAGHLPPLLASSAGVRPVALATGQPIGLSGSMPRSSTSFELHAGDVLALFTDGLVEQRGESIDDGLDRFAVRLGSTLRPGQRLDELADALVPESCDDDIAMLLFRWRGPATRHAAWFLPSAASISKARAFVASELETLPREVVESAVLLTSELATNAVLHAGTRFQVAVEVRRDAVRVEVRDQGRVRRDPSSERPDGVGGRGLALVERLSSGSGISSPPGGTLSFFELSLATHVEKVV
jgi:anti-sigma regulatory factor (Ser/Thr protein kinase)